MYGKLEGAGEVQVTLLTCLIKHNAKNICRRGGLAPPFLLSVLDGSDWSVSVVPYPRGISHR